MNLRQYFKNIDPETKAMWRKVLWLLILCLLAFTTGYYTARETNPKPVQVAAAAAILPSQIGG